jgi:hypothetical protein
LPRRIVQVVVTTNYVTDFHIRIVDNDSEVVGWRTIGSSYDQVIELCIVELDAPSYHILDDDRSFERIPEAHNRIDAGSCPGAFTTTAVIPNALSRVHLALPQFVEFLARTVAVIGLILGKPLLNHFTVSIEPLRLEKRTFIRIETQPRHTVENGVDILRRRTFPVGIFNPKNELAVRMARIQPAKKRCADAAEM